MHADYRLEALQKGDFPGIKKLTESVSEIQDFEGANEAIDTFILEGFLVHPHAYAKTVKRQDKVVGLALAYTDPWLKMCYLWGLAVHHDHRNKGIGHLLFEELMAFAASSDNAFVCCEVQPNNQLVLDKLKKNGFRQGRSFRYLEKIL